MYLTRDQVRQVDQLAIEQLGIPGIVLMENAARNAAAQAMAILPPPSAAGCSGESGGRVIILCGGGNNGGDGYAIARLLHNAGFEVTIHATKDPAALTGDAATNARIARKMKLPINMSPLPDLSEADLLIDALLGTGFIGQVRPEMASIITSMNASKTLILAVDVPSGLDCDTGQPAATTVRAATTVTFVAQKVGFAADSAKAYLGRVVVADIGTPPSLIDHILRL